VKPRAVIAAVIAKANAGGVVRMPLAGSVSV
jgi:hypothetical protein